MRLKKLEALRGFAAFYVVLHHSLPHHYIVGGVNVGNLLRFGQEAVILFFLLSGFVINYSFQVGFDKSFKNYFLKRFSRIFIPLIIIMFLGYVIESIRLGGLANIEGKTLFLNLLMLQDIASLKPNVIVEPYMHNSPLWSLSYEWWFYMIFFPILLIFKNPQHRHISVYCLAAVSSVIYLMYPEFVPRLFMYISIWWTGVYLSDKYISGSSMGYYELRIPLMCLFFICVVLGFQSYNYVVSGHLLRIGAHPFLELRHHIFALAVVIFAVAWKKMRWIWFNAIFSHFIFFAPMSYVIYISHHYLVVDANYLSFIDNKFIEWIGYLICVIVFSWIIEVFFYPKMQRMFLRITNKVGSCKRSKPRLPDLM